MVVEVLFLDFCLLKMRDTQSIQKGFTYQKIGAPERSRGRLSEAEAPSVALRTIQKIICSSTSYDEHTDYRTHHLLNYQ